MASSDSDVVADVLNLTGYEGIVTESKVQSLLEIAKEEIETEVGSEEDLDFYANNANSRALFWLTCLFVKIHVGEYEGMDMAVSEIELNQIPDGDEGKIWLKQYHRRVRQMNASSGARTTSISRTSRSYGG